VEGPHPLLEVSDSSTDHLIVFARWPEAGTTKTRLIPALGAAGAADLQRRMTQHTLRTADRLAAQRGTALEVRFAGGDAERMGTLFGSQRLYRPQGEGDLGGRLTRAIDEAFAGGAQRVVVIGTDCPALDADLLGRAFEALGAGTTPAHDVVLGPADDGGYYLIGLTRPQPRLFDAMPWSTDGVLAETLRRAHDAGLRCARTAPRPDVDLPDDLPGAYTALERTLSVIVPTHNEGPRLATTLAAAQAEDAEVLVVDGGSTDDTVAIAHACGVRVLESAPGRAAQMNAGAAASCGGVLLFCHADTHLPADYAARVREALATPRAMLGAFEFALRGEEPALRRIERAVHWRTHARQMPYGDQALFLRRAVFDALGGYRALPIMEDYDLVVRAKKRGRVAVAEAAASTSARFWREHGMVRGTLLNQAVLVGWRLGIAPATLARWRRGRRKDARAARSDGSRA